MEVKDEKEIFIVTCGEYSDYHIDRVFSSREKAKEYLDTKSDDYRLEEYVIDEPFERKEQVFCVSFELEKKKVRYVYTKEEEGKVDLIKTRKTWHGKILLDIYVKSDSRKRAIKVASERYGAVIANEQTVYPYLRVCVVKGRYSEIHTPYYDFNTGEIVLFDGMEIGTSLPSSVKVRKHESKVWMS